MLRFYTLAAARMRLRLRNHRLEALTHPEKRQKPSLQG